MDSKVKHERKTEDVNNASGSPSALNVALGNLVDTFNRETKILIEIDCEITLDVIYNKRNEINHAIKRLKLADKMLSKIHNEYTLMLELGRDDFVLSLLNDGFDPDTTESMMTPKDRVIKKHPKAYCTAYGNRIFFVYAEPAKAQPIGRVQAAIAIGSGTSHRHAWSDAATRLNGSNV